jgi:hypothetical protein
MAGLLPWDGIIPSLVGGDDAKYPLSVPQRATADTQLVGVWRLQDKDGQTTYCHVGRADDELPVGVRRMVSLTHGADGKLATPSAFLLFTTTIGLIFSNGI